jgi:DNA-binding transcriptional LysR family regulator
LGVAVIPRPRDVDPRKLRCIPIKGREPLWEISLLTTNPSPINPAARALIDAVLADQSPVAETAAR